MSEQAAKRQLMETRLQLTSEPAVMRSPRGPLPRRGGSMNEGDTQRISNSNQHTLRGKGCQPLTRPRETTDRARKKTVKATKTTRSSQICPNPQPRSITSRAALMA
jgi:hypothetical protein